MDRDTPYAFTIPDTLAAAKAWYRFITSLTAVAEIARMPEEKLNRALAGSI